MQIDWQQLCLLLRLHYKPLSNVAKEVNSDWRHLNRLARGEVTQPRFLIGIELLKLALIKLPKTEIENLKLSLFIKNLSNYL